MIILFCKIAVHAQYIAAYKYDMDHDQSWADRAHPLSHGLWEWEQVKLNAYLKSFVFRMPWCKAGVQNWRMPFNDSSFGNILEGWNTLQSRIDR